MVPPKQKNTMKTQITRWNPLREMDQLQERMNSLWNGRLFPFNGEETVSLPEWTPAVDIVEDEREFLVKAELPEMKREDIKVTVEDRVLTITGERKQEKEEKNKRFHRVERSYGSFSRSFTLPATAGDKVTAEFKDGLLRVHLPKDGKPAGRTVEIKSP
jgi:HSP20 family protein